MKGRSGKVQNLREPLEVMRGSGGTKRVCLCYDSEGGFYTKSVGDILDVTAV